VHLLLVDSEKIVSADRPTAALLQQPAAFVEAQIGAGSVESL
jgi:hypothetical protein